MTEWRWKLPSSREADGTSWDRVTTNKFKLASSVSGLRITGEAVKTARQRALGATNIHGNMTSPKPVSAHLTYELRVSLQFVQPEVWRVLRVPHDLRMSQLHKVLQAAFAWTNSHLHQFHVRDTEKNTQVIVGDPRNEDDLYIPGEEAPAKTRDERKVTLAECLLKPGDQLAYEYDFGDGWIHEVTLVAVHEQATRLATALCLDGARACPPEDCGGPPGYDNFLTAIGDPAHEEHESMLEWVGGDFDPAAFDLGIVARALAKLKG